MASNWLASPSVIVWSCIDWDYLVPIALWAHMISGISRRFSDPVTVPLHSPNGRHVGLCKETVKESTVPWGLSSGVITTEPQLTTLPL